MQLRYSTKTLLAAFTVVSVSIAGLLYASPVWAALFYTAAMLLVLAGISAAILTEVTTRGYWVGFAVFAAGYFLLAERDQSGLYATTGGFVERDPTLITTHVLIKAHEYLAPWKSDRARSAGATYPRRGPRIIVAGAVLKLDKSILVVGHTAFTLVFALIGGALGRRIARPTDMPYEPVAIEDQK